jgi:hypothetical protein
MPTPTRCAATVAACGGAVEILAMPSSSFHPRVRPYGRRASSSLRHPLLPSVIAAVLVSLAAGAAYLAWQKRSRRPLLLALTFDPAPTSGERVQMPGREGRLQPAAPSTRPAVLQEPVIHSYENLDEANAARRALLDAGVPADRIEVRVLQDEAGPTEGNFLVGNGRTVHGGPPDAVLTGPEVPYEENFARTVTRGAYLVMVSVSDPAARQAAERALSISGGVDPMAEARKGA